MEASSMNCSVDGRPSESSPTKRDRFLLARERLESIKGGEFWAEITDNFREP